MTTSRSGAGSRPAPSCIAPRSTTRPLNGCSLTVRRNVCRCSTRVRRPFGAPWSSARTTSCGWRSPTKAASSPDGSAGPSGAMAPGRRSSLSTGSTARRRCWSGRASAASWPGVASQHCTSTNRGPARRCACTVLQRCTTPSGGPPRSSTTWRRSTTWTRHGSAWSASRSAATTCRER